MVVVDGGRNLATKICKLLNLAHLLVPNDDITDLAGIDWW